MLRTAALPVRLAAGAGSAAACPNPAPALSSDLSRPIRIYKMTETYAPGDRVEHPKFGQGVVGMLPGDGKMNVFFENGRKTLAHDR